MFGRRRSWITACCALVASLVIVILTVVLPRTTWGESQKHVGEWEGIPFGPFVFTERGDFEFHFNEFLGEPLSSLEDEVPLRGTYRVVAHADDEDLITMEANCTNHDARHPRLKFIMTIYGDDCASLRVFTPNGQGLYEGKPHGPYVDKLGFLLRRKGAFPVREVARYLIDSCLMMHEERRQSCFRTCLEIPG